MNDANQLEVAGSYDGLYLDLRTTHVVAMGEGAGDQPWVSTCNEEAGATAKSLSWSGCSQGCVLSVNVKTRVVLN